MQCEKPYNRGALKKIVLASGGDGGLRCAMVSALNNDGQLDIVVANYGTNNIDILFKDGNCSFKSQVMLNSDSNSHPSSIAFGDLNGDNRLNIYVANIGDHNIDVFFGYDDGSFANQMNYSAGSYSQSVAVGDFKTDTCLDIVVTNYAENSISVLLEYDNRSFQIKRPIRLALIESLSLLVISTTIFNWILLLVILVVIM